jgi:3-oxoacyl-[acyl-carrier-protein] synthase-3
MLVNCGTFLAIHARAIPPERVHNNIQKHGNTAAATIPICMYEAIELGKIKLGEPGLPGRPGTSMTVDPRTP